jgi:PAS domain S-box-containing protein
MGSQAFAAVPVVVSGRTWGFLGFGETRYERVWSSPEVEALKAAAAVFGASMERERRDEALRESEERLKRLAAATFEGIALTENGVFLDANDQLAEMLGCAVPDLLGRPVEDFVPLGDHALVRGHRESGFEGPYEHHVLRQDRRLIPVEVRARQTPYLGRTVRVTAVRDVTERVAAQERQRSLEAGLRQAAEEWRQTFDALDLGIILADPQGRIVRLNRGALERLSGPSFADAVGRGLDELAGIEPWRTAWALHGEVGESGASVVSETRDPASRRAYYLLASPWWQDQGLWRVITFRDVTEFTHMQSQLRRAKHMEAMGSLVAGVAHEVRNPLFSISASVDALEAEFGHHEAFAELGGLLRSQVHHLTQLMRDLLDYGKPALLRPAPTNLGDLVRRAVRACASLARERNVAVEEHVAPELPPLEVDGGRMEQAVENLLANAIQHAPASSVVRIRGELDQERGPGAVRCTVEDAGPGLPVDPARIFEPFFTRRKGGTGLGLSIVQRIVEAHGGSVTAETRTEGGARFTIRLPAGRPEGALV